MNSDDDPPSRAAPSSSHNALERSPLGAVAASNVEWPDDETYAGAGAEGKMPGFDARRPFMTPRQFLAEPALELNVALLAGSSGLDRPVAHSRIQKSGLALAGHFHGIVASRIQILGQTEQSYLDQLTAEARQRALTGFFGLGLSCVFLTGELGQTSSEIVAAAEITGTPLLHAAERSSMTITSLHALLDERLAPRKRLHGVLIDVFGVGLLLMGPSGVGKSECALDLVMRGHRLVADDVVECDYRPPGMVFGAPAKLLRHHLEVRGLGILNIKDLFGVTAIRERKRIDVLVRLVSEEAAQQEIDRLGLDERFHAILGVSIPEVAIPVRPGRDMASILEVAARNELLKNAGHHAARELFGAIESQIAGPASPRGSAALDANTRGSAALDANTRGSAALEADSMFTPVTARAGAAPVRGAETLRRGAASRPRAEDPRLVRSPRVDESSAPPPVVPRDPRGRR